MNKRRKVRGETAIANWAVSPIPWQRERDLRSTVKYQEWQIHNLVSANLYLQGVITSNEMLLGEYRKEQENHKRCLARRPRKTDRRKP